MVWFICWKWKKQTTGDLVYQSLVEQYQIQLIEDEQFWQIYQIEDTLIFQSLNRIFLFNQSTNEFKQIQPDKPIIKSFVVNEQLFFHLETGLGKITLFFINLWKMERS